MKDEKKTRAQLIEELHNLRAACERLNQSTAGKEPGANVFRSIVENANDAIISINTDGCIVFFNHKAEEMCGYTAAEVMGKPSSYLMPEGRKDLEKKAVDRHSQNVTNGLLNSLKDGVILRKNGTVLPVEACYYGYHLNGEYFMTGILRDISDRKRIEKSLEAARDFSDNIIESSLDPIVITDATGAITRTNGAFLRLLGLEKADNIIGQHMTAFSPAGEGEYENTTGDRIRIGRDFFKAMQAGMIRLSRGEKIYFMESYHLRTDNKIVPVEDTISPLFDENGAILGYVGVIRDITDRKCKEKELSDSRDFYARLFDTSMEGLLVSDERGYITMVNKKAAAMLAYSKEELLGQHFGNLGMTLADEKEKALKTIEDFLNRGELNGVERTWIRKDGTAVDVEMNIYQIKDKEGAIMGAMASFRDISLRKKADMALRISEERYRRLFENAFVALQEIDISPLMSVIDKLKSAGMSDMRVYLEEHPEFLRETLDMSTVVEANEATLKLYGARDKEELMHNRYTCLREESVPASRDALIAFAEGKPSFQTESVHYTIKGIQKNVLMQMNFLVKQRDSNRLLMSIVDITPIKKAEIKLLEYQRQLQSLTNELSTKEENERRNLGMYLHDRIGQSLSALKMQLEMMASEVAGGDGREKVRQSITLLEKTIHDTRLLSYELSPVILHELGLDVALGWLAEQIQNQHNLTVAFMSDNKAKAVDNDVKIILYRAVGELLHNVVKHAWAQHVAVSIKRRNGQVQITVEDDGVGFDPAELEGIAATERGFGLFSIKERLHYLGGSMRIKSALYKGTHITLLAPLK